MKEWREMKLRRIEKGLITTALLLAVITSAFAVVGSASACGFEPPTVTYVGRDDVTEGNWIGHYGSCGYALPYTCLKYTEVETGETTGICGCLSSARYWWSEPWSVPGPKYYPYMDYLGGQQVIDYEITGAQGAPRALVDANSIYYRPSWYCNDSSITITLSGITGSYNVSIYFLDWNAPVGGLQRQLSVNVTSNGYWDATTLGTTFPDNFAAGTYAIFRVNSGGLITIKVTNLGAKEQSAVMSGIFLDHVSGPVTGVSFVGFDHKTKGNWRPTYGKDYYLLPGFNVPLNNVPYTPINKAYDKTSIPAGNYTVSSGACQYAADYARAYGVYPFVGQYSAYTWTDNSTVAASDTRVLIYPKSRIYYGYPPTPLDGRIYGQWDSGELNGPLNYFTMTVEIPKGKYIFSVYAMDLERISRSETIQIWDSSMTTLLNSQHISGGDINNGIYVQWAVSGRTTINIKVIADPGNLNCFINGIFLDCARCY
jgi:hypothetical protein